MAYHIFLKSLRSLQEFRKNPHLKIPPKSPPTKFQSFAIIKNQIFIRERIFLHFRPKTAQRPIGPSCLSARPPHPHPPQCPPPPAGRARAFGQSRHARPWRNCQKPPLLRVCAARQLRLLPLSPPRGPHLSSLSSPRAARPQLKFCRATRSPALDANQSPFTPRLDSPLNPR
jgi:hypothetical protein